MKGCIERAYLSLLFLALTTAMAAQGKNGVIKSFTVEAPDTVEQGVPFPVTYKFTARQWDAMRMINGGNGIRFSDVKFERNIDSPTYRTLAIRVWATTSLTGEVALPRVPVPVGDKTFYSDCCSVYVKSNRHYGKEMEAALRCLEDNGIQCDSVVLKMTDDEGCLKVFADDWKSCFVIVADKSLWDVVCNPILAYSTESTFLNKKDAPQNFKNIVGPLSSQLIALQKGSAGSQPLSYTPRHEDVKPMASHRRWHQGAPYNLRAPHQVKTRQKAIIGCVPMAMVTVMDYYKWPVQGRSQVYYKPDNLTYRMDFTKSQPQWNDYKDNYVSSDTANVDNLSQLMVSVGIAVDATFQSRMTSAAMMNVKHVMCNNLCYSGKMIFRYDGLTDEEIASILYRDLDAGRPCIVSSTAHAFVCDGYHGDFFHFNLGWGGFCNGYYRLKVGPYEASGKSLLWLQGLIHNIQPEKHDVKRKVILDKAGSLQSVLSHDSIEDITSLTIKGPLNGSDIRLLRHMAGAPADTLFDWNGGALRHLNLADATIISDKTPYLIQPARGTWTLSESWQDVIMELGRPHHIMNRHKSSSYNMSNVGKDNWRKFKRDIGSKHEGYYYTLENDTLCLANYHCTKGVIGKEMFSLCSSLQSLKLPNSLKKIDDGAFLGATSLQVLRVPERVKSIGEHPFSYCTSLEKLIIPGEAKCSTRNILLDHCSPILTEITVY